MPLKEFHHPFEPYDIQQQFMEAVYACIESGGVGIFESPTGTGKSLSLICGSLTWLREHKRKVLDEAIAAVDIDDDEPGWMLEHAREARRKEVCELRTELEERLEAIRKQERETRERSANGEPPYKRQKHSASSSGVAIETDEEQFVLDDYESEDEEQHRRKQTGAYSTETSNLMEKLGMLPKPDRHGDVDRDSNELKIYFCSRTHSQLSQFVGELQRVALPASFPPATGDASLTEAVKHLTLGSRKNLCINTQVLKLPSQTAVNERCIELQQSKTPKDKKCPFLPSKESADLLLDFRDHSLARIRDIEDLAALGSKMGVCPYYASRPVIGDAEIVTLPYPLLLQKASQEALGISLKGHVVIIDEAHNLMNAIEGLYSAQITDVQLVRARESLMVYLQKFRNRLKGGNRVYVAQVVRLLDSLLIATARFKNTSDLAGSLLVADLLSGKGVDQINVAKLIRYIDDSKLARKVEGYVSHLQITANGEAQKQHRSESVHEEPTLTQVQNFLMALLNPSKEGRFFWHRDAKQDSVTLRYLLLDPSEHFRDIVESARAVILAGGTMSPMQDYQQQLFPYLSSIDTLSCGHLISKDHLLVRTLTADGEVSMEFSYKTRQDVRSFKRTGRALLKIAGKVEGGLVVFFPSYGFLDQAVAHWRKDLTYSELQKLKPVFCDERGGSAEKTFKSYSESIQARPQGALLLSVIGGKLSEGINFSDDLGRCVVVVGLPFPNLETPEWKAKLRYIDEKAVARGQASGKASREHAENVCMRSVNQAIGRVIRHKKDWASIILMDARYERTGIKDKLPAWIKASLPGNDSKASSQLRGIVEDLGAFFVSRTGGANRV